MTDPQAEQPRSLIQQRLGLQRRRSILTVGFVLQLLGMAMYTVSIVLGREWFWWLGLVVFVAALGLTTQQLRAVRCDTREFEERNGPEAGVQK